MPLFVHWTFPARIVGSCEIQGTGLHTVCAAPAGRDVLEELYAPRSGCCVGDSAERRLAQPQCMLRIFQC